MRSGGGYARADTVFGYDFMEGQNIRLFTLARICETMESANWSCRQGRNNQTKGHGAVSEWLKQAMSGSAFYVVLNFIIYSKNRSVRK